MTNKMQNFCLFICTQLALHVSGNVFAHHQEHLTVFTASVIVRCHGRGGTEFHLVRDSGQQQHRWTISEAVNTPGAPDDRRKHRRNM